MTAGASSDTRQRFIDVAIRLFIRHSFAGTSLQMIADELGVTKAAVYHHFRTREALLGAVIEPLVGQLRAIVETAEAQRTTNARADHMLIGFATLAVQNRALIAILATDPSVIETLNTRPDLADLIGRQIRLLAAIDPGPAGLVKASMVLAGIAGATGSLNGIAGAQLAGFADLPPHQGLTGLDDESLREYLVEASRRTLGLRPPRRSAQ